LQQGKGGEEREKNNGEIEGENRCLCVNVGKGTTCVSGQISLGRGTLNEIHPERRGGNRVGEKKGVREDTTRE